MQRKFDQSLFTAIDPCAANQRRVDDSVASSIGQMASRTVRLALVDQGASLELFLFGGAESLWNLVIDDFYLGRGCKAAGACRIDIVPKMLNGFCCDDRMRNR